MVIYYNPRLGDLVVGVRGNRRALDVNVGARGEPALMLTKQAALISGEGDWLAGMRPCFEWRSEFAAEGRVGIVVSSRERRERSLTVGRNGKDKGAPVVGVGMVGVR